MMETKPAYAAYFNVARHNVLEVFNGIASKAGVSLAENDDQVADHPLLKQLKTWAAQEDQENGRINDKDIRRVKQVIKGLQKALPILHDEFAQNVSGQKIAVDFRALNFDKARRASDKGDKATHNDKPLRTWRLSDLHWLLDLLLKLLMALRNYYSHAGQDEPSLNHRLDLIFGLWFDTARREAKNRFEYMTSDVLHLIRHDPETKSLDPNALHAISNTQNGATKLTPKGTAFFCCLFLDKQQGNEFLKQIPGFKYDAGRPHQATLRTYTHWSVRLPFIRIETDSTHQSLGLDMLSELARCPVEIYEHLSPADQSKFEIKPEVDEDWLQSGSQDDEGGMNVRFIRHGDRFAPLVMRHFDHLAQAQAEEDPGIRFMLDLGDFYFAAYPKKLPDGSVDVRRLKQKVLRFGLLSEALHQAQTEGGKPPQWLALERTNTEREYNQPYIVQTQPHYHLNDKGGSIPIRLKPESIPELYAAPQIDVEKRNPDDSERYEQLQAERPHYWLSPYELVNLAFYHHLCVAHALPKSEFPRVDNLLKSYSSSHKRLYENIWALPQAWLCQTSAELDAKLKAFGTQDNRPSFYTLRSKDLPSGLQALLLRKAKTAQETMLREAQNTLKLLAEDGDTRLRDVQRAKQSARERIKPGKSGHRVLRAGEMATFLAKDMLRLQPAQDENKDNQGKPTSIMADLLQARLAYFGRDKTSLPALFNSLGLTGPNVAKCHPFLSRINTQAQGMNGIAQFYEAYLVERQKHLKVLQTQLTQTSEAALQSPALAWLHLAEVPQRLKGKDELKSLLSQYLARQNEPVNLPRGLFRDLTVKAMLHLGNTELNEALKAELHNEVARGRFTSPSVLVAVYMKHVAKETSQDFYFADMPTFGSLIEAIEANDWENSEWAKRTRERLKKANHRLQDRALNDALFAEREAKRKKLRAEYFALDRILSHRATQDQVLFLAAKRLMSLNHPQRKNNATAGDEVHANPFEKLKLQTLNREDLNAMVPHELRLRTKTDSSLSKTVYVDQIKAKNIGVFKRLARDRRLPGILHYYDAEKIHLSVVQHELQAYPRAQNQAFTEVLAFEEQQNGRQRLKADELPKSQSLHRVLMEQRLQQCSLPVAQQDVIKAEALTLRNAFCHNQIPTPETARTNTGRYDTALPMLDQARKHLSATRQDASNIEAIKGGNTVAEHFSNLLSERYSKLKRGKK